MRRPIIQIKNNDVPLMFWSQSFCLLSAGGAPIEVIRQYIETQEEGKSEHRVPFSDLSE